MQDRPGSNVTAT